MLKHNGIIFLLLATHGYFLLTNDKRDGGTTTIDVPTLDRAKKMAEGFIYETHL